MGVAMNMDKPKTLVQENSASVFLSIIIPIHNGQKTLQSCLRSIQCQIFTDFEVIMVDDGSTDESAIQCRRMCSEDLRFILLQQQHSGVSAARNTGLRIARGTVVSFIDIDDTVEPDYTLEINRAFQTTDFQVVFFGYNRIMHHGTYVEHRTPPGIVSSMEDYYLLLSAQNMFGYTWLKAYRREVLQEVQYNEDMSLFEDEVFTCDVLTKCSSVAVISKPIYNYFTDVSGSLSQRVCNNYCLQRDRIFLAWQNLFVKKHYALDKLNQIASECYNACLYHKQRHYPSEEQFQTDLQQCHFYRFKEVIH